MGSGAADLARWGVAGLMQLGIGVCTRWEPREAELGLVGKGAGGKVQLGFSWSWRRWAVPSHGLAETGFRRGKRVEESSRHMEQHGGDSRCIRRTAPRERGEPGTVARGRQGPGLV